ncbi:MAG: hypothetical protein WKG07_09355 [Hymenobacter sp.]
MVLGVAGVFCFAAAWPRVERRAIRLLAASQFRLLPALGLGASTATLLLLAVSYLVGSSFNPFIYFRF